MPPKAFKRKVGRPVKRAEPLKSRTNVRRLAREAPPLGTEMTTILVGSNLAHGGGPTTFLCHKALLMASSAFFAVGLGGGFREAGSGVLELPEEDPALFATFIHHAYFGRLFSRSEGATRGDGGFDADAHAHAHDDDDDEWRVLPRLYTLGERLDAPRFRDAVVTGVIDKVGETGFAPADWADYVYGATVGACPLRRLLVDLHVFFHEAKLLRRNACPDTRDGVSPDFLQDAVHRLIDLGKGLYERAEFPWVVDPCLYHEHGDASCLQG